MKRTIEATAADGKAMTVPELQAFLREIAEAAGPAGK